MKRAIKSNVSSFLWVAVVTLLLISQSACARLIIYPGEETATALAFNVTQTPLDPATATIENTPTETNTPQVLIQPTETGIPPTSTSAPTEQPPILYYTQSGDTLSAVANHFGVNTEDIVSTEDLPTKTFLLPDTLLVIPKVLQATGPADEILPDSEMVYSPSAVDFNIAQFVEEAGGHLSTYKEWRTDGWYDGAAIIKRVADENSINPRLLLAILEYQSHWVFGQPTNLAETDYPMGWIEFDDLGLYKQLSWAVQQLSIGFYGWRAGTLTDLDFPDSTELRIAPELNSGSVALQYLFSKLYDQRQWGGILYSPDGFPAFYENMFGNAWIRAQSVEPLFPPDITQPTLTLPFEPDEIWDFTGGPHAVWGPDGVMAALDFAPPSSESGCVISTEWIAAPASGLVVRSGNGIVVMDLDGDGFEQTGWVLFFLHVSHIDRVPLGTWLDTGDHIGHPSCEGGMATGTHFHIARKYNGEWIPADGPIPFEMSGWCAHLGSAPYEGTLTKGDLTVTAHVYGSFDTRIGY